MFSCFLCPVQLCQNNSDDTDVRPQSINVLEQWALINFHKLLNVLFDIYSDYNDSFNVFQRVYHLVRFTLDFLAKVLS